MLAPGTPSDPFQYIDVRDLADFIRTCVEKDVDGKFNLCGPQGAVTMGSLLDEAKRITKADTTFVWASPEFLEANEIIGEKAKGNLMPIWQPPVGDEAGLLLVSPARARKKGLKFRSLETTIRDTLEWQKTRPADKQALKAGLTLEREAELLKKLKAG
jgi:2'-hydroxyisoflavone reductase